MKQSEFPRRCCNRLGSARPGPARPVPSKRRYANGVALIETDLDPDELLSLRKSTERQFGRRSGGAWSSPGLTVPHQSFRERDFVLRATLQIAPGWRDPITGLSAKHLHARLTRPRRLPS